MDEFYGVQLDDVGAVLLCKGSWAGILEGRKAHRRLLQTNVHVPGVGTPQDGIGTQEVRGSGSSLEE